MLFKVASQQSTQSMHTVVQGTVLDSTAFERAHATRLLGLLLKAVMRENGVASAAPRGVSERVVRNAVAEGSAPSHAHCWSRPRSLAWLASWRTEGMR
mmetsp:Transcript_8653/g.20777  ORF Transcript_8653/g.20777 Transcript_8653/m.20777 type:complete len:98 (+) Transcript_8653:137-430(+)